MIEIRQIPVLSDNYIYVLHASDGSTAVVDAAVPEPVIRLLDQEGWKLNFIFNTHHHRDHVGANLALKNRYGCRIFGAEKDASRIPGIARRLQAGEEFSFGGETVTVLGCDGHTIGHIAYWLPESKALFCGDTIFSLGCGKLFEGTPGVMWETLSRLRGLPPDTRVFCAHEYTLENSVFALKAEPGNPALHAMVGKAEALRREGKPTVPSLLGDEVAANPFLRPESQELRKFVKKESAENWEVFGALREAKDRLDGGGKI